ncbi:hypothetical protein [Xylocopilactobacillus apicola]|uniref:Uncharacterized protein n=1 Tax=Xylocopilactobacillus apicola TaxID=2932184 RepID=A0AAU9D3V7_9LACO|nr:hypothetical protein [Xylocopilactobacillus apicola]BDR58449.1 hypothetical protein XA3_08900 [Xylocopilactobacillus apicola]
MLASNNKKGASIIFNQESNFKSLFNQYFSDTNYGFIFADNTSIIPYLSGLDNIFLMVSKKTVQKKKPQLIDSINQKSFVQNQAIFLAPFEKILIQYYRLVTQDKQQIITDCFADNLSINEQRKLIEEFSYLNNLYEIKQTIIVN